MVRAHAGLKAAAVTLFKIANDLRWLGSGPRTGIEELIFPANEPGSSIMPGKVNPTQAEAMLMVAIQVISSDVAVTMGGNEGNFELNAFRPILINNYLHSALILGDMCDHLRRFMIEGTKLNEPKLKQNIDNSVMMVTALSPVIGYDKAAAISYYAIDNNLTLKQAALAKGVSEELYDKIVIPINLTRPVTADLPAKSDASIGPDPAGSRFKAATLTGNGQRAQELYRRWADEVDDRLAGRFGPSACPEQREALAPIIGDAGLRTGMELYPDGWRAQVPRPDVLPHYPVISMRGGFPDGS